MYRYVSTGVNGLALCSRAGGQEGSAEDTRRQDRRLGCLLEPKSGTGLRLDLIARVREEIAAGTYDTPEKFEVAMERLLERL